MDPRPTTPTPDLEQESPQERLDREQRPDKDDSDAAYPARLLEALAEGDVLRSEELTKRLEFSGGPAEWKSRLWRLHNEGYLKVRWVGMSDPDPVEVRLAERGRAWLAARSTAGGEETSAGRVTTPGAGE
ncbi:MAG: hypothetical protein H0V09_06005 [Gemmatimonadetes bacterium]|nr:hypothetical protein [Gemmatimonadota bacterium]